MRRFLIALAALVTPHAIAQPTPPTWSVTLDIPGRGEIQELAIAGNGDIVVGGFRDRDKESVQASELDGWLARYAPDGRLIWEKQIGGPYRDEVDGLALAPDGSIYIAGPRDVKLRQSIQDRASYVSRYAADGTLIWTTPIDDPDGLQVWLTSLRLLDDGSVLVAGGVYGAVNLSDAYVARFSASGERQWEQWPAAYPEGVDPNVPGQKIRIRKASGEPVIQESGRLGRQLSTGKIELVATQPAPGQPVAARCIAVDLASGARSGETCGPMDDLAMHMTPASFPFTASHRGDLGTGDGVVRKYDTAGNVIWEFASATDDGDGFNAAAPTPDGGAVIAGYRLDGHTVERHNWNGVLVRLDREGKQVWRREFDGGKRDELNSVAILPDGSIVAAGYTTPAGSEIWKPWIMRLNPEGKLE